MKKRERLVENAKAVEITLTENELKQIEELSSVK